MSDSTQKKEAPPAKSAKPKESGKSSAKLYVVLAGVVLGLAVSLGVFFEYSATGTAMRDETLARVAGVSQEVPSSVGDLGRMCRRDAPQLFEGSSGDVWDGKYDLYCPGSGGASVPWKVIPYKVCIGDVRGDRYERDFKVYIDTRRSSKLKAYAKELGLEESQVVHLGDDNFFRPLRKRTDSPVLRYYPAVGLFGYGRYTVNHFYHLFQELVSVALTCFTPEKEKFGFASDDEEYNDTETRSNYSNFEYLLPRLPTQAALLHGHPKMARWRTDFYGSQARDLSAQVLNLLSHAADKEPTPEERLRAKEFGVNPSLFAPPFAAKGIVADFSDDNGYMDRGNLHCFCQGVTMPALPDAGGFDRRIGTRLAQRLADKQFRVAALRDEAPGNTSSGALSAEVGKESAGWPSWAAKYWKPNAGGGMAYQPKVLFLLRRTRVLANAAAYASFLQRELNCRVEILYPEDTNSTVALQYFLASTADFVTGIHGFALMHEIWLNDSPFPEGNDVTAKCKSVVEFLHWTKADMVTDYRKYAERRNFHYTLINPVDATFGKKDFFEERAERFALRNGSIYNVILRDSWFNQRAIYNKDEVESVWRSEVARFRECIGETSSTK